MLAMKQPADVLHISPEEQGRLLARVYAFILSDQFTGTPQEISKNSDKLSTKKRKKATTGNASELDAETHTQEPKA
jgi:hypothetical protein